MSRAAPRPSAAAFLGALLLLTIAQYWPVIARFGTSIPNDLGDPLLNVWILWWNAHHVPFTAEYWNAPVFAPAPNAFALSETLLGLTWLTTPLQWLGASPLAAYNVMFVLTPVLNGLAAYWLCLTLTHRRDAAAIGGLAYAFAPYHASQLSHLQTQATFWMPIALVGWHRYWESGRLRWLACFAGAATLNGFTCGYFFLYFSVFLGIAGCWQFVATRSRTRLLGALAGIAASVIALAPAFRVFRAVAADWHMTRGLGEIEHFSADALALLMGSDRLLIWPVHGLTWPSAGGAYPQYPGLVLAGLLLAGFALAVRQRASPVVGNPWRRRAIAALAALSAVALVSAGVYALVGPWGLSLGPVRVSVSNLHKPVGLAIYLLLFAGMLTPRFTTLVTSGSLPGLYATGAVAAAAFALGPAGRIGGERFWYRPPYAWLMALPGFNQARVPALFSVITVLCLAVLAAFVVARLLPRQEGRTSSFLMVLAAAIVLDGWSVVRVADVPGPLPVAVSADLVLELPRHSVFDDTAAMYRGIGHGRPVVNGYSGGGPPHYAMLMGDLAAGCLDSLDIARGGRSLDVVVWRASEGASAIGQALSRRWGPLCREDLPGAIVCHVPRIPGRRPPAIDPVIDLSTACAATRK